MTGLIFDLDQTLVETSFLERLRKQRNWGLVLSRINEVRPYDGIPELLEFVSQTKVMRWSVVTSSPRHYAEAILNHHGWVPDALVAYHDTANKKPHPDPTIKAITEMRCDSALCLAFGDMGRDIVSAKGAGARSVACLWGASDVEGLLRTEPDHILSSVNELREFVAQLVDQ